MRPRLCAAITALALGVCLVDLARTVADQEPITIDARTFRLPEGRRSAYVRVTGTLDRSRERIVLVGAREPREAVLAPIVVDGEPTPIFVGQFWGESPFAPLEVAPTGPWTGTIFASSHAPLILAVGGRPRSLAGSVWLVLACALAAVLPWWVILRGDPRALSRPSDAVKEPWVMAVIYLLFPVLSLVVLVAVLALRWWRMPGYAATDVLEPLMMTNALALLILPSMFRVWGTVDASGIVASGWPARIHRLEWSDVASVTVRDTGQWAWRIEVRPVVGRAVSLFATRREARRVLGAWLSARGAALDAEDRARFDAGEWVDLGPIAVSRVGLRIAPDKGVLWQHTREVTWAEVESIRMPGTRVLTLPVLAIKLRGRWLALARVRPIRHPWLARELIGRIAPHVHCKLDRADPAG